jgi:hypothetical protein
MLCISGGLVLAGVLTLVTVPRHVVAKGGPARAAGESSATPPGR